MEKPFTTRTGVKIGLLYVNNPKPRPIEEIDMLRLQHALITTEANQANKKVQVIDFFAAIAAFVTFFILMVLAKGLI
jgi:hypothetical protein